VHFFNGLSESIDAAGTMLAPATGREVVVSRGQLIETGDGFRAPNVI